MGILSLIIFIPLVCSLLILFIPARFSYTFRYLTLVAALVQLGLCIKAWADYRPAPGVAVYMEEAYSYVEHFKWIRLDMGTTGMLDISYFLAADGISLALLTLSAVLMAVACWSSGEITKNRRGFFVLLMLLDTALMGVFTAFDFFLFYIFFELMLVPLYFLIGMWGGARREYASIKFFLYTLVGSVFMLLVILGLYFSVRDPQSGHHTFNMLHMLNPENFEPGSILAGGSGAVALFGYPARLVGFIVMFIAFAIKVPVVPVHTWLPDAHVEAPTPVSIILAGVVLKVGGYGLFRICYGIFPEGGIYFGWWVGLAGLVSIIYGALTALASTDLKRMIACSSISHMGFVLLGLASLTKEGVNGALFQLISHGILSSMLFYIAGIIYNRSGDRTIANFRGLASPMPVFTAFVLVAFFASLGLPGFSGFIAELFVLLGAFMSEQVTGIVPRWMAVTATAGILLGAGYFLWTIQRMFLGNPRFKGGEEWYTRLYDLKLSEKAVLLPLALLTLILGIYPSFCFRLIEVSTAQWVSHFIEQGSRNLGEMGHLIGF